LILRILYFFKIKFKIKFNNTINALENYWAQLNNQNSNYFWADIEIYRLLDKILKYDYFINFNKINKNYIEEYNKFNDKICYDEIAILRVRLYRFNKKIK